jgi:hypothetical protein
MFFDGQRTAVLRRLAQSNTLPPQHHLTPSYAPELALGFYSVSCNYIEGWDNV